MANIALGLIEIKGKLSAIVACDAALKAANVHLLDSQKIKGGITTIMVYGDVAAVQAAVDAGKTAVEHSGALRSTNVIPRLDDQVKEMLDRDISERNQMKQPEIHSESFLESQQEINLVDKSAAADDDYDYDYDYDYEIERSYSTEDTQVTSEVEATDEILADDKVLEETREKYTKEELHKLKVTELRTLAYRSNIESLKKSEIKYATKEQLVDSLLAEGVLRDDE
ncbi:hypothetical protein CL176_08830 [Suicoccus acidiformans]|uniref:BMC domain-containing protein n=1 Tax=Suicoccus acidiformans TaxID=2036206 RepID=A0A347WLY9_9LACT|nr:BMC domain-containing protein [Suicoccus acidiformans]AXY26096.1 hypothetical protein CL176_08830 [Suicoccus acidiformans]